VNLRPDWSKIPEVTAVQAKAMAERLGKEIREAEQRARRAEEKRARRRARRHAVPGRICRGRP